MITLIINDQDAMVLTDSNEQEVKRYLHRTYPDDGEVRVVEDGDCIDECMISDLFCCV